MLVDLGLPDLDGVDLIRRITSRWPDLPVLVITVVTAHARILAALRAGAVVGRWQPRSGELGGFAAANPLRVSISIIPRNAQVTDW